MKIAPSQYVLSMPTYAIGLFFLVEDLHRIRVPMAFKEF